jgi:hypothetical protein
MGGLGEFPLTLWVQRVGRGAVERGVGGGVFYRVPLPIGARLRRDFHHLKGYVAKHLDRISVNAHMDT